MDHLARHKVKFRKSDEKLMKNRIHLKRLKSDQLVKHNVRLKKSVFIKNRRPIQALKYVVLKNGMSSTDPGLSYKLVKTHTNFTNRITNNMQMLPSEQCSKTCKGGEGTKQDSMVREFKCYENFNTPIPIELGEGLWTPPHCTMKLGGD